MPDLDSLSFALLVPFAVCFILIFVVCCFADEIKDICRLPSPLPSSYIGAEHSHQRRRRRHHRRSERHDRRHSERIVTEDAQRLILNEEGRSRNVSESSSDFITHHQSLSIVQEQEPSTSGVTSNASATVNASSAIVPLKQSVNLVVGHSVCPRSSNNFTQNISIGLQTHSVCSKSKDKATVSVSTISESSARVHENAQSSTSCDSTSASVHTHQRNKSYPLTDVLTSYLTSDQPNETRPCALSHLPSTNIDRQTEKTNTNSER